MYFSMLCVDMNLLHNGLSFKRNCFFLFLAQLPAEMDRLLGAEFVEENGIAGGSHRGRH